MSINTRLLICRLLIVWITLGTAYGAALLSKLNDKGLIVGLVLIGCVMQLAATDLAVRALRGRKTSKPQH